MEDENFFCTNDGFQYIYIYILVTFKNLKVYDYIKQLVQWLDSKLLNLA
jgi:hypothetical protein